MEKNYVTRRPKYTRHDKSWNKKQIEPYINSAEGWTAVWRSYTHVSLMFDNGRRLECYPTVLGLQHQGKGRWLRYFNVTNLQKEIARFAAMDADPADDIDVLEDF